MSVQADYYLRTVDGETTYVPPREPQAQELLQEWLHSSLIPAEEWEGLGAQSRSEILHCLHTPELVTLLVKHRLLTQYQAERAASGHAFGLILDHYRVLEPLRKGSMALVFRAEHMRLRQLATVKVLPVLAGRTPSIVQRFDTEVRALGLLRHPHIVRPLDAGRVVAADPRSPVLHYLAVEYVEGQDLEELVLEHGPLPTTSACRLIHQTASALVEAHKHQLIHRDIKPANVMVTLDGQAKLLDFGLVRDERRRMTSPGIMLGTLAYIAPEQTRDSASVDVRADVFGLGATLFWCLTGQHPFNPRGSCYFEMVQERRAAPTPSVREHRADVPAALEAVVARMMAQDRDERYATAQAAMQALADFLEPDGCRRNPPALSETLPTAKPPTRHLKVLVVDDNADAAESLRLLLTLYGYEVTVANSGTAGVAAARQDQPDVVVCDIMLPGMDGYSVATALRRDPGMAHSRLIALTACGTDEDRRRALAAGFDDHFTKPIDPEELLVQVCPPRSRRADPFGLSRPAWGSKEAI